MGRRKELAGQKFGRLLVLEDLPTKNGRGFCLVKCDCGVEKNVKSRDLLANSTKSCGCLASELSSARRKANLTGIKFNMLTVLREDTAKRRKNTKPRWICRCDCGTEKSIQSNNLLNGNIASCGCLIRRTGENNPQWKGGTSNVDGYIVRTVYENGKKRHVKEHRFVMEQHLGRKLYPSENVHHKNGIRNDNRIENLEIWVKTQPCGQRVEDLVEFSLEILQKYAPEKLK